MSRQFKAMTRSGGMVDASGDSPLDAMRDAASRCEEGDWPIVLYEADERGAWVRPVWGGRRGLASEYPEDESCGCRKSCHYMRPGNTRGSGHRAGLGGEPRRLRSEEVDADDRQAEPAAAPG
jgi:hypothetical protein